MQRTDFLKNIRKMDIRKLMSEIARLKNEIANILMNIKIGKEKNVERVKKLRRDIARLNYVISEKKRLDKEK